MQDSDPLLDFLSLAAPKSKERRDSLATERLGYSLSDLSFHEEEQKSLAENKNEQNAGATIKSLLDISKLHASTLSTKQSVENEVQALSNSLWSFPPAEQLQAKGICGCGNTVVYSYTSQALKFNEQAYSSMMQKFQHLSSFNSRGVFLSLFEQTVAERRLIRLVYDAIDSEAQGKHVYNLTELLDTLFEGLKFDPPQPPTSQKVPSAHTIAVIQRMVLLLGTTWLALRKKGKARTHTNLLDLDEKEKETDGKEPPSEEHNPTFLVSHVATTLGAKWAQSIIQPSIDDLFATGWLGIVFSSNTEKCWLTEADYIALLTQVPWMQLADRECHSFHYEDIKASILPEIQKGIEMAVRRQFLKLLFMLGTITVLLSCLFPSDESILRTIMMLARGPWPSEPITYPLLTQLPWSYLSRNGILIAIGELYHLHPLSVSQFIALPEQKKMEHRAQFAQLLFNQQEPMTNSYSVEPKLKDIRKSQGPPLFSILLELVGIYNKAELLEEQSMVINLEKFVVEELLFFSCIMNTTLPPSPHSNQPLQQHPVASLIKDEATIQLISLLTAYPHLLGYVIHGLGCNLPLLQTDSFLPFFTPALLASWVVDINSFNWMCYFLTHRNPPGSNPSGVEDDEAVDLWLRAFLLSPPQVQFPPKANAFGIQIGSQMMEKIDWSKQLPSLRMKAILVLLASKPCVNTDWLWAVLLGEVGTKLTAEPLDGVFIRQLLANNYGPLHKERHAITCADELSTAQILVALSAAEEAPDPQQGMEGLVNWGIFQKLTVLSQNLGRATGAAPSAKPSEQHLKQASSVVHTIFLRILKLASKSPERCWRPIAGFVADAIKDRRRSQDLRNAMFASLSVPENHTQCLLLWTLVLSSKTPNENVYCALLDAIIHGMFCERAQFTEVADVIATKNWDARQIQSFISSGFPWLAYVTLLGYRPKLPSMMGGTRVDIRETSYWLLKEVAISLGINALALPFWEQFFILHFEAVYNDPAFGDFLRESLNPHWTKVAQHFEHAGAQRVFYSLYYSFTTWSADIIAERGQFFSSMELLRAFLTSHPPLWALEYKLDTPPHQSDLQLPKISMGENFTDLRVAALVSLLPEPLGRPLSLLEEEHRKNVEYQQGLQRHLDSILTANQEETPSIIVELESSLSEYSSLVFGLKQMDDDFLELSRKLYQLSSTPFQVTMSCQRGTGRCVEPAFITGYSSKIIAGLPTARENIELNRRTFNEGYVSFFKLAQNLADLVSLLQDIEAWLLQDSSPSTEGAVCLFFSGLKTVLANRLPPNSPLSSMLIKILHNVGARFIRNNPNLQKRFLHSIITFSSSPSLSASPQHDAATPQHTPPPTTSAILPATMLPTTGANSSSQSARRFNENRATLFDLFTPNSILTQGIDEGAKARWYELLGILANRKPNRLVYEEELFLASRFEPNLFFSQFSSFPREMLEGLLSLIRRLLGSKACIPLGAATLQALFKHDSFLSVSEVLILLLGDSKTVDPAAWPVVFTSIDLQGFTWQQAVQLLKSLSSCFPLPIVVLGHVLEFARRIVSVPSFTLQLQQENAELHIDEGPEEAEPEATALWGHLLDFFANTLISVAGNSGWGRPSLLSPTREENQDNAFAGTTTNTPQPQRKRGFRQDKLLSDSIGQSLCAMILIVRDVVSACPPLIDRVWHLYSSLFAAYAEPLPQDQMDQFARHFTQFRWSDATFHIRDSAALRHMCRHVLQRKEVVCAIFGRLPWHEFERVFTEKSTPKLIDTDDIIKEEDNHSSEEEEERIKKVSKSALYFLKLFLLVNVIEPHIITPELRTIISSPANRTNSVGEDPRGVFGQTSFSMPWAMIDFSYFEHVFDGTTLLMPFMSKKCVAVLSGDVAYSLISNSHYLFDVAKTMKHPVIASDCVREVRSLLFFCLQSRANPKLVWHLSYAQIIGLVTSIVIPLTREWGSYGHVGPHMIISLLSTVEEEWRSPLVLSFSFSNSDQGVPPPRSHSKAKAFNETLLGLVTQFAASSTPPVAIEILNTAASALQNISTLFLIYEETLHAYFTQCTKPNALIEAAASLQRPMDMKWEQFMAVCNSNHTCLTLLVVLCQQRRQLGDADGQTWAKQASLWMSSVVSFVPSAHHDFYVMGLWFFALSLLSDSRWSLQNKDLSEKVKLLERQLQGYSGVGGAVGSMESILGMFSLSKVYIPHNPSPRMALAASGCLIYLYRSLTERGHQPVAKEMEIQLDRLLNSRKQFPEYEAFFAEAESILSPLTDLAAFKQGLVDTLSPIAPFLTNF